MKPLTKELLMKCKKARYKTVTIGEKEYSGHCGISCLPETDKQRIDSNPGIWQILADLFVSYGCGSSHSHQISETTLSRLDAGTWELQKGQWVKK